MHTIKRLHVWQCTIKRSFLCYIPWKDHNVEICSISVNFANAIRSTCSSPSQPPPPEMGGGHFLSDNDAAEVDAVCGGEVDRCDVAKMEHR